MFHSLVFGSLRIVNSQLKVLGLMNCWLKNRTDRFFMNNSFRKALRICLTNSFKRSDSNEWLVRESDIATLNPFNPTGHNSDRKKGSLSILHSYCVLIKTHMGKSLFSPELKSYSITQWNCTTIGSCSGKKRTNGSAAELHEPMATIPARSRQNGRGIWLYKRSFRHRILRFFSFSDDDFVYTDPEAYSPLTRLAAGPSDLDLLGWSAFSTRPSIAAVPVPFAAGSPSLMLQFSPAASLDLRWKDSLSASQRHRRRHRLCDTSCPSAPAQQLLRVAPGLRRLSSPRNLHLPFPPLSLLGLSSREGVHAQPDATPLRSARAPDPR